MEGVAGADAPAGAESAPLNDNISESSSRRVSCTIGRSRETFGASRGNAVASAAEGAMSFARPSASMPGSTMGGGASRGKFRRTLVGIAIPAASAATSALLRLADGSLALEAVTTAAPSGSRFSSVSIPSSARGAFANARASSLRSHAVPWPAWGVDGFVFGGHASEKSFAKVVFDFTLALRSPASRSSRSMTSCGGVSPRTLLRRVTSSSGSPIGSSSRAPTLPSDPLKSASPFVSSGETRRTCALIDQSPLRTHESRDWRRVARRRIRTNRRPHSRSRRPVPIVQRKSYLIETFDRNITPTDTFAAR
jgi:hypothetical protein